MVPEQPKTLDHVLSFWHVIFPRVPGPQLAIICTNTPIENPNDGGLMTSPNAKSSGGEHWSSEPIHDYKQIIQYCTFIYMYNVLKYEWASELF